MAAKPLRRFELIDVAILVAAMAVGATSIRPWLLHGWGMLDFFMEFSPSSVRATGYMDAFLKCVEPWLASLTVAMVIIRLRRSRLPFHRLARQPGMAACLAASATMAAQAMQSALAVALLGVPLEQESFYLKFLMPIFGSAGAAVAAVWLIMAIGRAWRPDRGWVDRSGRVIGVVWIVVFLAMTWDGFWLNVVSTRVISPLPTTAQQAAQKAKQAEELAEMQAQQAALDAELRSLEAHAAANEKVLKALSEQMNVEQEQKKRRQEATLNELKRKLLEGAAESKKKEPTENPPQIKD